MSPPGFDTFCDESLHNSTSIIESACFVDAYLIAPLEVLMLLAVLFTSCMRARSDTLPTVHVATPSSGIAVVASVTLALISLAMLWAQMGQFVAYPLGDPQASASADLPPAAYMVAVAGLISDRLFCT